MKYLAIMAGFNTINDDLIVAYCFGPPCRPNKNRIQNTKLPKKIIRKAKRKTNGMERRQNYKRLQTARRGLGWGQ